MERIATGFIVLLFAGCDCSSPPVLKDSSIDFGEAQVGASVSKKLLVENPSETALKLLSLDPASSPFSVKFIPLTVPAKGSVAFDATFAPVETGRFEKELTLTTSEGIARVLLRGTGTPAPVMTCKTFADIDFGAVAFPGEVVRALSLPMGRLAGGDVGMFRLTANTLVFAPTAVGTWAAQVEVQEPGCTPVRFTARGQAATKNVECLGAPIDFGTSNPGAPRQLEVQIQNSTTSEVVLANIAAPAPFSAAAMTLTVPARSKVPLAVTFRPTALGSVEGTMTASQGFECVLRGRGGGPDIEVTPTTLAFGPIAFFASAPTPSFVERTLRVRNPGTQTLVVSNLMLGGANADSDPSQVTLPQLPLSVPGGGELGLRIRVAPNAANKVLEWNLVLTSNDADEQQTVVRITASSVELPPCNYSVTPTSLSFGRLAPPDRRELVLSIRNFGANAGETCLISALELAAGSSPLFYLPGGPIYGRTLMPGEVLEVPVRAVPTTATPQLVQHSAVVNVSVSSPTGPLRSVPLSATVGQGCVAVSPRDLDFGSVAVGCNSETRNVTLYNTCPGTPVTLQTVQVATPELTAPFSPGPIATSMTVPVMYRPSAAGADTGLVTFKVVQDGQVVDEVVHFKGAGNTDGSNVDEFRVTTNGSVDLLVVRDNSASMASFDAKVRAGMDDLLQRLLASSLDFHLGVTDTELGVPQFGELIGTPRFLTRTTPNLVLGFQARIASPLTGFNETLAEAVIATLRDPRNVGFLRDDAVLAVLVVSDGDENPTKVGPSAAQLERARGNYHVIASCPSPNHAALISALGGGSLACITDTSWATFFDQLIQRAAGGASSFTLTAEPASGISVEVDGLVVLPTSGSTTVWTFDAATRRLTFSPNFKPPIGSLVRVTYSTACH